MSERPFEQPPTVVIVGAGFGGLTAEKALRASGARVVIVDRANYHTFQPLLYQVATAGLDADDIAYSIRGIVRKGPHTEVRLATVTGVDAGRRLVLLADHEPLPYDFLILAAGAVSADFGVAGVAENAFGLKSVPEALALRSHELTQFERAADDPSLVEQGALTVVVAGGGPTGVELAGAFSELFAHVLARDFPTIDRRAARVVLIEATDRLLGTFHPELSARALSTLRGRGVEVHLETVIAAVDPGLVTLAGGATISCGTVVWAAGVKASPLADGLGFAQGRAGRIMVGDDLSVPGHPEVFVIGDLAEASDRQGGNLPQLGPVAMQQARHVAREIVADIDGKPRRRPFRYFNKGTMATIGRNSAVAQLPGGIRLTGFLGWLSWLLLHLVELIGFRNRANVLVNWAWNYVTYDRGARLIIDVVPPIDTARPVNAIQPVNTERST
jgi:NADH:quinone reductase (non-electrogenic)